MANFIQYFIIIGVIFVGLFVFGSETNLLASIGIKPLALINQDCPYPGADPQFCNDIAVLNWNFPNEVVSGEKFTTSIVLKNYATSSRKVYVESAMVPTAWPGYAIAGQETFATLLGETKCCPGNEFYAAKEYTLAAGEQLTVYLEPYAPTEDSYDHCFGSGSAFVGYNDNYVIGFNVLKWRDTQAATCYPNTDRTVDQVIWGEYQTLLEPENPTCDDEWVCDGVQRCYQNTDCSLTSCTTCANGCTSGVCNTVLTEYKGSVTIV